MKIATTPSKVAPAANATNAMSFPAKQTRTAGAVGFVLVILANVFAKSAQHAPKTRTASMATCAAIRAAATWPQAAAQASARQGALARTM